jgi:3-methyladenine DNA glycosylase AlkD
MSFWDLIRANVSRESISQNCRIMGKGFVISRLRKDLAGSADAKTKAGFQRFFKQKVKCYGVKSADVVRICGKYRDEIKHYPKQEIFNLCGKLYSSDYCEEAFIASAWVRKLLPKYSRSDIKIFRRWINGYINNWAKCDGFCNHSVGSLIEKYPELVKELRIWAGSKNIWLKRAAAVSLIAPARKGKYLPEAFEISEILLKDPHDMVQKGYGWLLKEESRKHENEVFQFVMRHKKEMPRTSLRYAIELMPGKLKAEAMIK